MDALADVLTGIILSGIYTGIGRQGLSSGKPGDVSDLSDQLRAVGRADSVHAHHRVVFRRGRGQAVHFGTEFLDVLRGEIQLLDAVLYQLLINRLLRKDSNKLLGTPKKTLSLPLADVKWKG